MPSLLELPPELLDQIIEEVINFEKALAKAPASITDEDSPRRVCRIFQHHKGFEEGTLEEGTPISFLIDPKAYQPNTLGLLLTNRQLRAETLSCLRRHKPAYHVNARFVSDKELRPTWTWIPTAPVQNEAVDLVVNLELVGPLPFDLSQKPLPLSMWLSFHALIMRFLRHGPVGPLAPIVAGSMSWKSHWRMNREGDHFAIKTLYINYLSRDEEINDPSKPKNSRIVARGFHDHFVTLLRQDPKAHADGPDLLFRAIGRIVILCDGERACEWDVAACVKYTTWLFAAQRGGVRFGESFLPFTMIGSKEEEEELKHWYMQVCGSRRRLGLGAPDNEGI